MNKTSLTKGEGLEGCMMRPITGSRKLNFAVETKLRPPYRFCLTRAHCQKIIFHKNRRQK